MHSTLKRTASLSAVLALLAAFCFPSARAGTTGKLSGTIVDAQTKEALFGVNVFIPGTSLGAASDLEGTYFIINVPPGTYQLRASAVGYRPVTMENVKVSVDQTTRVSFELQAQTIEVGAVEITATRPIVQRDLTSTTSTVTSDQLAALPVEDVQSVINLQAGVVEGHFRGGRSNEVKYLIDGVSVNDVFSGTSTLEPEVSSLEEVQVLSGTFNAEYGEALSGVVNQVTKIASERYTGDISVYTGDYLTTRTELYRNIGHISPADLYNFEASLSGPIPIPGLGNSLRLYLSGRHLYDAGYLYGQRVFSPSDSSYFSGDPSGWRVGNTGDGAYVPMNSQDRYSLQSKLSVGLGGSKNIIFQGLYQDRRYRNYNFLFQLNPDGDYRYYQKSFLGSASYTHVISDAAFVDIKGSAFITDYKQYTYENPVDDLGNIHVSPYYVKLERFRDVGGNAFYTGGTQNWHIQHHTVSYSGKLDATVQVDRVNQIKAGAEFQSHTLRYEDYQVHVDPPGYVPSLPPFGSFDFNVYRNHPYQMAGYVQDKIELEYLVVNVGLRIDYFEPDGRFLINPNTIAELDELSPPFPDSLVGRASAKRQFSPRVGLSYPISDRGAVHIAYGHFFQIPAFEFLYRNPNFRIPLTGDLPDVLGGNTIGNADLEPQRTTMYEIGLQQEVAQNTGITVTAFGKDIRNLLGVNLYLKNSFKRFAEYVNRDYGQVWGVTLSFEKRLSDGFGMNVDYTYQVASGDASDPNDTFNKQQASPPIEPNKQLVPLNWDRRHSLNFTLTTGDSRNIIGTCIGRLGSGLPYTPALQNQRTGLENSSNRPSFFNLDMVVTKFFSLTDLACSVFLKVYNVFDNANEINVFTDTGRAGYTIELTRAQQAPRGYNTTQDFFTRPDYFSSPRQVILGGSVSF